MAGQGSGALGDGIDGRARSDVGDRYIGGYHGAGGGTHRMAMAATGSDWHGPQGAGRSAGEPGAGGPGGPRRPGGPGGGRGGPRRRRRRWSRRRKILTPLIALAALAALLAGGSYAYLRYRYDQIKKVPVVAEHTVAVGAPFNMLVIGSDSRAGAKPTTGYGTVTTVGGQRSDVTMVVHVVPATKKITILSLRQTTLTQMDGKARTQFGQFSKLNAAYNDGATDLVQTIQDNFGIPINHVVQVNFAGFKGAVSALGGIYMDFEYPSKDTFSGLDIPTPGCHLLNGTQALAVVRSQDFEYFKTGQWYHTPLGDLARIRREDSFLKALVDTVKTKLNPLQINAFLGSLPQGIVVDKTFSLSEMINLAESFHSVTPDSIASYTLPTLTGGNVTGYGDVLFVNQPSAQELLTKIFGSELTTPTTPPPNQTLTPEPPPAITPSTSVAPTSQPANAFSSAELDTTPPYDPAPCTP